MQAVAIALARCSVLRLSVEIVLARWIPACVRVVIMEVLGALRVVMRYPTILSSSAVGMVTPLMVVLRTASLTVLLG